MQKAKKLKIRVFKAGKEKVNLTLPIYSLKIIESLIPENVQQKLKEKEIVLKDIISQVEESGCLPQSIFHLKDELNHYDVWIE